MRAAVHHEFGSPDVVRIEEIERPVPNDDQVLIHVHAAAINPLDWHFLEGTPYLARPPGFGLLRPEDPRLGVDFSGTVDAVGKNVTAFKIGDEVFGGRDGALAEYVCMRADEALVAKPPNISFEEAASVPIAGITALQALRDRARLAPGVRVLINGASGGVGTFAVQIAKSFGAHVTGVCSTRNLELVRSLGADAVIDYTHEDFTRNGQRYDVILDNVGNRSILECLRALEPKGRYVLIAGGGAHEARWLGPLPNVLQTLVLSRFSEREMGLFMANMNGKDLAVLADMLREGKLKPVIDRRYPLAETREALRYLEQGHARGKIVIMLDQDSQAPTETAGPIPTPESRPGAVGIALTLFGAAFGATIAPIVFAFVLNRRFQRRHPGRRPFRYGYWFSLQSCVCGLLLGVLLGSVIVFGLVYALLAWAFARRQRWAWIALTILSFNPILWIIHAIYLRKRWSETPTSAPAA